MNLIKRQGGFIRVSLQAVILTLLFFLNNEAQADYQSGTRVQVGSSGSKVRASAGSANILGTNSSGTYGTILSGPINTNISGSSDPTIYHWYHVDWDSPAVDGWSADVGFSQPTPNSPTPTSPGYEGSPGQVVGSSSVQFSWSATSSADASVTTGYQLNVRDLDVSPPNDLSNYSNGLSTSKTLQLIYGHHYRWNAFAFNANLYNSLPDTLYFWIAPKPTLNSPGYATSPGQNITTLTPTLNWNAVNGAQGYKVYVLTYPYSQANTIYTTTVSSGTTSLTIPTNLPANSACLWKVTALFNDALQTGVESAASDPLFFQTPQTYKVNVQVVGDGTYSISPPGGNYLQGTSIVITSSPRQGSQFSEWRGSQYGRDPTLSFAKGGTDDSITLCFVPALVPGNLSLTVANSTPSFVGINVPTPTSWLTLCEMSPDLQFWQLFAVLTGETPETAFQLPSTGESGFVRATPSPQVSTGPFLTFPIHDGGYNAHTAPVTAIMDHMRAVSKIAINYDHDGFIRTAEGKTYAILPENNVPNKRFAVLPPGTVVSSSFHYVGVSNTPGQNGPGFLQYDGHPGYDYGFGLNTAVYAAAPGDVVTDDDLAGSNLEGSGIVSFYMAHYHALIINHKNGYWSIYMHLSAIDSKYVDISNPNIWKPIKKPVSIDMPIGATGNFDDLADSPLAYHFHFELWRLDEVGKTWNFVDPYGFSGPNQDGTGTVVISPALWN